MPLTKDQDRIDLMTSYVMSDYTLQEVADIFDISRQRVHQILKEAKVEYRVGKKFDEEAFKRLLITCPICQHQYIRSGKKSRLQERERRKRRIPGLIAHCNKYNHPDPNRSNWQVTQKVVREYKKGASATKLKEKYNLRHVEVVYTLLKQWGIKPRYEKGNASWDQHPVGRNKELQLEVVEALKTQPVPTVAYLYSISKTRVYQLKKKYAESTQNQTQ